MRDIYIAYYYSAFDIKRTSRADKHEGEYARLLTLCASYWLRSPFVFVLLFTQNLLPPRTPHCLRFFFCSLFTFARKGHLIAQLAMAH